MSALKSKQPTLETDKNVKPFFGLMPGIAPALVTQWCMAAGRTAVGDVACSGQHVPSPGRSKQCSSMAGASLDGKKIHLHRIHLFFFPLPNSVTLVQTEQQKQVRTGHKKCCLILNSTGLSINALK